MTRPTAVLETSLGKITVELYADTSRYLEVENQGAYGALAPGAALVWTVRWYARQLPAGLFASPGPDLLSFVRGELF